MEDGRDVDAQGQRARDRHRRAQVHVRLKRPGMLYGKVLYPPQFGATLISLDASAAEAMPGVKVVHEGNFVAVAAPAAGHGGEGGGGAEGRMEAGDGRGGQPHRVPVFQEDGARRWGDGSESDAIHASRTSRTFRWSRARRWREWEGDKLTVWTGSQRPFGVRSELAQAFGIPEGEGARDRARHRIGLRRQAQRRRGDGGGAHRQGVRQAGEAQLDARRRDDVGVLPSGRR